MVTVAIPALGCLTTTTWTNVPVKPRATLAPVWLVYLALPPLLPASDQLAQVPVKLTWELVSSKVVPSGAAAAATKASKMRYVSAEAAFLLPETATLTLWFPAATVDVLVCVQARRAAYMSR